MNSLAMIKVQKYLSPRPLWERPRIKVGERGENFEDEELLDDEK